MFWNAFCHLPALQPNSAIVLPVHSIRSLVHLLHRILILTSTIPSSGIFEVPENDFHKPQCVHGRKRLFQRRNRHKQRKKPMYPCQKSNSVGFGLIVPSRHGKVVCSQLQTMKDYLVCFSLLWCSSALNHSKFPFLCEMKFSNLSLEHILFFCDDSSYPS